MSYAVAHQLNLETEDCCNCGIVFAMPAGMRTRLRTDGGSFYCPNGHQQHYTTTEVVRLRDMLEDANRKNTALAADVCAAQVAEQQAVTAAKRLKRRISAGLCPCCNRTFQNLAQHMATKHKDAT